MNKIFIKTSNYIKLKKTYYYYFLLLLTMLIIFIIKIIIKKIDELHLPHL